MNGLVLIENSASNTHVREQMAGGQDTASPAPAGAPAAAFPAPAAAVATPQQPQQAQQAGQFAAQQYQVTPAGPQAAVAPAYGQPPQAQQVAYTPPSAAQPMQPGAQASPYQATPALKAEGYPLQQPAGSFICPSLAVCGSQLGAARKQRHVCGPQRFCVAGLMNARLC